MSKAKEFAQRLQKNHLQMAAFPDWARAALSTGGILVGGNKPDDYCREGCPCHEIRRMRLEMEKRIEELSQ